MQQLQEFTNYDYEKYYETLDGLSPQEKLTKTNEDKIKFEELGYFIDSAKVDTFINTPITNSMATAAGYVPNPGLMGATPVPAAITLGGNPPNTTLAPSGSSVTGVNTLPPESTVTLGKSPDPVSALAPKNAPNADLGTLPERFQNKDGSILSEEEILGVLKQDVGLLGPISLQKFEGGFTAYLQAVRDKVASGQLGEQDAYNKIANDLQTARSQASSADKEYMTLAAYTAFNKVFPTSSPDQSANLGIKQNVISAMQGKEGDSVLTQPNPSQQENLEFTEYDYQQYAEQLKRRGAAEGLTLPEMFELATQDKVKFEAAGYTIDPVLMDKYINSPIKSASGALSGAGGIPRPKAKVTTFVETANGLVEIPAGETIPEGTVIFQDALGGGVTLEEVKKLQASQTPSSALIRFDPKDVQQYAEGLKGLSLAEAAKKIDIDRAMFTAQGYDPDSFLIEQYINPALKSMLKDSVAPDYVFIKLADGSVERIKKGDPVPDGEQVGIREFFAANPNFFGTAGDAGAGAVGDETSAALGATTTTGPGFFYRTEGGEIGKQYSKEAAEELGTLISEKDLDFLGGLSPELVVLNGYIFDSINSGTDRETLYNELIEKGYTREDIIKATGAKDSDLPFAKKDDTTNINLSTDSAGTLGTDTSDLLVDGAEAGSPVVNSQGVPLVDANGQPLINPNPYEATSGQVVAGTPEYGEVNILDYMGLKAAQPKLPVGAGLQGRIKDIETSAETLQNIADTTKLTVDDPYTSVKMAQSSGVRTGTTLDAFQGSATAAELVDETEVAQTQAMQSIEQINNEANALQAANLSLANVDPKATVQGQLALLSAQFKDGEVPVWAQGAMRTATGLMAQRGLGSSSMAAEAITTALLQATIPIAQQDASFFQSVTLENLSNNQQVEMQKFTSRVASIFNDQAATNTANNLNTTEENKIAEFFTQLSQNVALANASQTNAMEQVNTAANNQMEQFVEELDLTAQQFNADGVMEVSKFNSEQVNVVNQFNADMDNQKNQLAIDASNVQWRRDVNTANTAMANTALQVDSQNLLDIQTTSLNNIWQHFDSVLNFAFQEQENESDRNYQLMLTTLANEMQASTQADSDLMSLIGTGFQSAAIIAGSPTGNSFYDRVTGYFSPEKKS